MDQKVLLNKLIMKFYSTNYLRTLYLLPIYMRTYNVWEVYN